MNHIGMTRDGGYTSLMMASGSGHADVVRALIEADPSPKKHIQMKVLGYYAYGVRVVDGLGACVCEGLWKGVHAPGVIATTLSAISLYLTHPCTISLCVGNVGTIDDSRVVCLLTPHSPSFTPRDLFCLPHLPPLVIAEQEGEKEGRDGSIDGQERRDQSTAQSGGSSQVA